MEDEKIHCRVLFYAQTRAEEKSHKSGTRVGRRVEKFFLLNCK